jgi:ABC-2 type transport system permease protein
MREIRALFRAGWMAAMSYRTAMLFSLLGLGLMLVPVYFVAQALQGVAAKSIQNEGGHYLGFLIIGLAVLGLVQSALTTLPTTIGGGIGSGTFEALLATPSRLPFLLLGLIAYESTWSLIRVVVMLAAAAVMGVSLHLGGIPAAALALLCTVAVYLGIALGLSAMILVFRTTGPLTSGIVAVSALLGGAYYSTSVIPSWIQKLSAIVPLTYGLRAIRQALLSGAPWSETLPDIIMTAAFAIFAIGAGGILFLLALQHARKEGSLGQY